MVKMLEGYGKEASRIHFWCSEEGGGLGLNTFGLVLVPPAISPPEGWNLFIGYEGRVLTSKGWRRGRGEVLGEVPTPAYGMSMRKAP
jgi:hypothetical protein